MKRPYILCVDDEKMILESLYHQLKDHFAGICIVEMAQGGEEALDLFNELISEGEEVAVVISDQIMPIMKGDELLIKIHLKRPEVVKILLTGQATTDALARAINHAELFRMVAKPWNKETIIAHIEDALKRYALNKRMAAA